MPFFANISIFVTVASPEEELIITLLPDLVTVIFSPPTVVSSVGPSSISPAFILLGTTCLSKTFITT